MAYFVFLSNQLLEEKEAQEKKENEKNLSN